MFHSFFLLLAVCVFSLFNNLQQIQSGTDIFFTYYLKIFSVFFYFEIVVTKKNDQHAIYIYLQYKSLSRFVLFCFGRVVNRATKSSHRWPPQSVSLIPTQASSRFHQHLSKAFSPISFCQKITNSYCKHRKGAQNTFVQKKLLVKCW